MNVLDLKKQGSSGGWKNRSFNPFIFKGLPRVLSELP